MEGADVQRRLEHWLLETLSLVIHGHALKAHRRQLTAMSEFALAAQVLADCETTSRDWRAKVVGLLAERYRETSVADSLISDPASAPAHAWLVEALHSHHAHHADSMVLANLVREAVRMRSQLPTAFGYPLIRIEARYLDYRLGKTMGEPADISDLVFGWPQEWAISQHRDIYELVHIVFFLSDFGRWDWKPGREALVSHQAAVANALTRAVKLCLEWSHFDLVGEVALAYLCFGDTGRARPLLTVLTKAQRPEGALPGWSGAKGIAGLYHATLIALLAFGIANRQIVSQPAH
jgi:hypothetical protein